MIAGEDHGHFPPKSCTVQVSTAVIATACRGLGQNIMTAGRGRLFTRLVRIVRISLQ